MLRRQTRLTDDRTGEVGEDSVGYRRTEHGKRQHPSLDIVKGRETLLPVEGGSLDTGTVLCNTRDRKRPEVGLEPFGVGWTVGEEEVEDETPGNGDASQDVEDQLEGEETVTSMDRHTEISYVPPDGNDLTKLTFHLAVG